MGDLLPALVDVVWHLEPPLGDSKSTPAVCLDGMERNKSRGGAPVTRNDELLRPTRFKVVDEPGQRRFGIQHVDDLSHTTLH